MISDRNLEIYEKRQQGNTYSSIAREYNITPGRAREIVQILSRAISTADISKVKNPIERLAYVDARAYRICKRNNINTLDDLKKYIEANEKRNATKFKQLGKETLTYFSALLKEPLTIIREDGNEYVVRDSKISKNLDILLEDIEDDDVGEDLD